MNDISSKKQNRLKTQARVNKIKNQTLFIEQMAEDVIMRIQKGIL